MIRTFMLLFAVALCPSLALSAPSHWRVVWRENPQTSAIVSWSTSEVGEKHQVRYKAEGAEEWETHAADINGKHSGKGVLFYHHAKLTGLKPWTRYDVVIESDGESTKAMWFRTAPDKDVPVQVIFGGDSRSGHEDRRRTNGLIARLIKEQSTQQKPPVVAFAHGGDYIVDGRKLSLWSQWLSDHELTVTSDGQLLPIIPARGNHDMGPLFNEVFAFPKGDGNWYATDLSPEVRLVTLNTETSTGGEQRKWLEQELLSHAPERRWVFAQYHKPAFPAVKVPSGALMNWVPLFEKHGVTLSCEADGHCIKRTAPILDGKVNKQGVVYIGEGGLGVGQRTPKEGRWFISHPDAKVGRGHHIHLLTFGEKQLKGVVLQQDNSVFDEFALKSRSKP